MDLNNFIQQNPSIEKDKIIIKSSILDSGTYSFQVFLKEGNKKLFEYEGSDLEYNPQFEVIQGDNIQIYLGE